MRKSAADLSGRNKSMISLRFFEHVRIRPGNPLKRLAGARAGAGNGIREISGRIRTASGNIN